uniref:Sodium/calcium exchanger membrane region domain-containing protein n=1 Tax=Ditylenchus dipsaci TaxID=166011 RepID=A0A915CUG3_9BILA
MLKNSTRLAVFKIYHLFKIPCMIFLKYLCLWQRFLGTSLYLQNSPCATNTKWSNLHFFLVLALVISITLSLLVILFTKSNKEPKYYKQLASYAGFVMSIAWIYGTASEIVNVVLMFGNLFGISYQILGLTAVSWCNSVGDMIADVSVARQGFPRMAFSAAIGGPLLICWLDSGPPC